MSIHFINSGFPVRSQIGLNEGTVCIFVIIALKSVPVKSVLTQRFDMLHHNKRVCEWK